MIFETTKDTETDTSLQAAEIAAQNDLFRKALIDPTAAIEIHSNGIHGQVFVTPGVSGEGMEFQTAVLKAVATDDQFDEGNDPYGDHTFGTVTISDQKLFWKIDGVDAPSRRGIAMCQTGFVRSQFKRKEASMSEISILAIDLAKHSFQVCATTAEGVVVFNRKYTRGKLEQLLTEHPLCLVAMEACATSHHWGRFATELGHDVRLIPPIYVKPFVKRSAKNDANDAAAIATAVRQPGMRFVKVKSQEQQSHAVLFRTHQTLTRQRAQLIITLRGHLAEHGVIVAKGNAALLDFENTLESENELVPVLVLEAARLYYHHIEQLAQSIATLERQMGNQPTRQSHCAKIPSERANFL